MEARAPKLTPHLSSVRDFMHAIPFNRELGIIVVDIEPGTVTLEIPFRDALIGDPSRPALHGGVISSIMDTAGGAAVWTAIGVSDRCSTIDLRVDYLLPGRAAALRAEARVLRVGNKVGVTTIRCYHPDRPEETVAEGKGVYSVKRVDDK